MKNNKKSKELALELYAQGYSTDKIAKRCKVSVRTIQRWLKQVDHAKLTIVGINQDDENLDSEGFQTEADATLSPTILTIPVEKVADLKPGQVLNLDITSVMAVRLLNLTQSAIASIEECFSDPTARRTDKLRAAQLVGDWLGLSDGIEIFSRISRVFDLTTETDSAAITKITPKKVMETQELERKKVMEIQKVEREELLKYNDEIYDFFLETLTLPDKLDKKFDLNLFLKKLKSSDIHLNKAKNILQSRGYDC